MNKLTCPTVDELSRFNLGKLPEDETIRIGEHLDECEACRAMIDTISDASDTLASALKRPAPHNEYENESALKRAALLIQAIGREPSFSSGQVAVSSKVDVADLGELGQYKLLAKLGEGGMGAVYKALHTSLKRLVALKVLPTERMKDEQAVNRFRREMEAVGQLDHPNIVRATDAGEVDQTHYLVMELVDGVDLSTLVRRVGPLAPAVACELVRQAAVGLQEAHEHGMVHRDIKPSNLMLARQKRKEPIVKVLDLGLALLDEHRTSEQRGLTSTGQMMGTLDYMAPEQGGDSHIVDIRADIYALGATLYKLLCGQAPFAGEKYDTPIKMIRALALETPVSIGAKRNDLPAELVAVVDRMLAKNPDDRFAEPEEVAEALAPFAKGADLALLLRKATEEDANSTEDASGVATNESLKSDSVETAPTIDIQSSPHAPHEEIKPAHDPVDPLATTLAVKPSTANPAISPSPRHPLTRSPRLLLTAAALGGIILLSAILFYIKTNHGTIVVEIDDPSIAVTVQGEDIQIAKNDSGEAYQIKPGEHTLHVQHGDLEFDTDKFKLSRGEKMVLSVRLVEGEVQVVQNDEKQTVIGSEQLPHENRVLAFDGESSYVEMPSLKFDTSKPNTLEAWVSNVTNKPQGIVQGCEPGFPTLQMRDGGYWQAMGSTDVNSVRLHKGNDVASTNTHTHLAAVWTGTETLLFINGKLEKELKPTGYRAVKWLKSKPFEIGTTRDEFEQDQRRNFFHGIIDEVRISSVARYEKDFTPAERFEPDEHTLALYHFDEGQGEIAHDSSPNKHHGKIIGAKWVKADDSLDRNRTSKGDSVDRSAAEWVLKLGGKINIRDVASHEESTISSFPLPKASFKLSGIDLKEQVPDGNLQPLAGLKNLEFLFLNQQTALQDADLNVVMSLCSLRKLIVANAYLTDRAFVTLNQLQELEMINLYGTQITGATLVQMQQLPRLEEVYLKNSPSVVDADVKHLVACNNLVTVSLEGTNITDVGLLLFAEFPSSKKVNLRVSDTKVTVDGVARLRLARSKCYIYSDFTNEEIAAAMAKLKSDEKKKD